jgi:hypothetical protein
MLADALMEAAALADAAKNEWIWVASVISKVIRARIWIIALVTRGAADAEKHDTSAFFVERIRAPGLFNPAGQKGGRWIQAQRFPY